MDKSTIICRCEEINIDEIESAVNMGAQTFDDIKRITRCGMGPCQAKICMNLVRELISDRTNTPLGNIAPAKLRMPLKMTRMEALAGDQESSHVISVFDEGASKAGDIANDK